jgi:hypothetical protein
MFNLPSLRELTSAAQRHHFAKTYTACSGLPVPEEFAQAATNQIFGMYAGDKLIGGFILGHGPAFRTIAVFAGERHQPNLYDRFSTNASCTEICCFFIASAYRRSTFYNFSTWAAMIYAQVKHGREIFLFGTCSRSLAKLYGQTEKTILIHEDVLDGKPTFIFWGERRSCVQGMLKIMSHKLRRVIKISRIRLPLHMKM